MKAYIVIFLVGCALVNGLPVPSGEAPVPYDDVQGPAADVLVPSADAPVVPYDDVQSPAADVSEPSADIPVPYDDIQAPAADIPAPYDDVQAPSVEFSLPQEYPEAAYEEGAEVDYETSIDVLLNEVLGRNVNVEAPSPFGQGVNGEDGPNSVVEHIANLPAGIPFEADFETDVNVDVADSSIHTLNVKVKPHSAY